MAAAVGSIEVFAWRRRRRHPETCLRLSTLTFLFSDIEGFTRILKESPERYADVLRAHGEVLQAAFWKFGGHLIDTQAA